MSLRRKAAAAVFAALCASLAAPLAAQAPARPAAERPGQMPTLPLTEIDDRAVSADLDRHAFTLTFAQPLPIKDLLLLLVRGTSLSLVPDPGVSGSFIGELKNVSVRQALDLVLPPFGLDYSVDGSFVRVFHRRPETRLFEVDYLAVRRAGETAIGGAPGAAARVSTSTSSDVFADLGKGVKSLLSEHGTFSIDPQAGLVQVTDLPERLDRVGVYLDAVQNRVQRQVQIDARVLSVELTDPAAEGLDWAALAQATTGRQVASGASGAFVGLHVTDVAKLLEALGAQGKVSLVAHPRLLAMNNEPSIVRAVSGARDDGSAASGDAVTLSVTPQVSPDGVVMLSLSPIVRLRSASGDPKAPATSTLREADMLARVADGETRRHGRLHERARGARAPERRHQGRLARPSNRGLEETDGARRPADAEGDQRSHGVAVSAQTSTEWIGSQRRERSKRAA